MKAFMLRKRASLRVMVILCTVLLLATPAMALTRGGLSGVWQDWGDGVWDYYYYAPTNCEFWRFKSNQEIRFAYGCGPGQWWQYTASHGGFFRIGHPEVGDDFLGDDNDRHVVTSEWSFQYYWNQDCAYWIDTSDNEYRFAYKYGPGQWWDYTNQWSHLGLGALATAAFIGDGDWHTFDTSNMTGGNYLGYTANADFRYDGDAYYWRCAGIERYKFVYGEPGTDTGSWYYKEGSTEPWKSLTYSNYWENPDLRYHGGGVFIQSGLSWDEGSYWQSFPSPQNLGYNVIYHGDGSWNLVTRWNIPNPGLNRRWNGVDLNVLWCDNDFNAGYAEYTAEDVVVFNQDMSSIGFGNMVDWMTLVRDFFRQNIRTTMVAAHGNSTGWYMGQWMDTSNYGSFQSDWERWGTLMTADAQVVSIHEESGQATEMLDAIAAWSGCDIYANTNITHTYWEWIIPPNEINPDVWNQNQKRVTWLDVEDGALDGSDRVFEYTTTGLQDYRWILYY